MERGGSETEDAIVVLELFSGIGGMRLALRQALEGKSVGKPQHCARGGRRRNEPCRRRQCRFHAYDVSPVCNAVYAHNFGGDTPDARDLKKVTARHDSAERLDTAA